ncbi:class I SAM-dependent methyltransferase [Pseudoalteromonas sp. T1lg75]|uniref:class I SAM-dependent methyltransferase n=1 Tax=Pseudoalteromonas sp. T1lg75 TaxID=2077102 RepID=UPI000CF627F4|nr:class I SAM-dependent methyltransferase [Pseudoalteromonas sp. BDTF-M6]
MRTMKAISCPLCDSAQISHYHQDKVRDYWQCADCALVFVAAYQHLSAADEKAIYDQHENDLNDEGYRRFLTRIFTPLNERLTMASSGLDFGCGPAPMLATMLQEQGHTVALYDLYYQPQQQVLQARYDFVCSTEVIEHLAQPQQQLQVWLELLRPGGTLALMTKLVIDVQRFATWHYKNDPTHIAFYSKETFAYIAERFGLTLEFIAADVIFLTKPAT